MDTKTAIINIFSAIAVIAMLVMIGIAAMYGNQTIEQTPTTIYYIFMACVFVVLAWYWWALYQVNRSYKS